MARMRSRWIWRHRSRPHVRKSDDLAGRIFIPGELQQGIVREMNLVPSDLGSLLSECYFDPYAEPTGTDGVGYREIGRTGKKAARGTLSTGLSFSKAEDLSYLRFTVPLS